MDHNSLTPIGVVRSSRQTTADDNWDRETARMTKRNFNVSFPLWDWLLGSLLPPAERPAET